MDAICGFQCIYGFFTRILHEVSHLYFFCQVFIKLVLLLLMSFSYRLKSRPISINLSLNLFESSLNISFARLAYRAGKARQIRILTFSGSKDWSV